MGSKMENTAPSASQLASAFPAIDEMLTQKSGKDAVAAALALLAKTRADLYWVGVYLLSRNELVVGPYVGPETDHVRIPVGRGVCGTAVAENKNQIVDDVSSLQNYLACNLLTKSEIVVLIREPGSNKILGQIDIDSTKKAAFSKNDEQALEELARRLAPHLSKC